jgi:hypothetical protein
VLYNFSNQKLQEEYESEIKIEADKVQKRITATSIYPIRIVYATVADFLKDEDRLIAEARNTGFCIGGNLEYYKVLLNRHYWK